jgi:bacteriocin biosynthesis cyclodehydratase domain-containing protein
VDQDIRAATVALAEYAALRLPDRPRLVPWLVAIELGDARLQLRSAESAHTLTNPLLIDTFTTIRSALDGRHTVDEIVALAGDDVLPTTIFFLLKLLHGQGLLQTGLGTGALDEHAQARWRGQLRFLDHFVTDASNAHAMLANSRVGLVGSAGLRDALSSSLRDIGIDRLSELDAQRMREAESRWIDSLGDLDLVVACESSSSFGLFEAINRACLVSRTRWLCVSVSGTSARLGPTIVPHQSACHTCLEIRLSTHQGDAEAYAAFRRKIDAPGCAVDEGSLAPFHSAIAAQAALEVMRLLTGFSPPVTVGRFYEFTARSPATDSHDVFRLPRCPSCSRRRTLSQAWDREFAEIAP